VTRSNPPFAASASLCAAANRCRELLGVTSLARLRPAAYVAYSIYWQVAMTIGSRFDATAARRSIARRRRVSAIDRARYAGSRVASDSDRDEPKRPVPREEAREDLLAQEDSGSARAADR
jgi:hypothetical protein